MTKLSLTIALDRYDRHVPFFMGLVPQSRGIDLRALEVGMVPPRRDGLDRHGRMLHHREFDICEMSLSSYIIAKSRGAPFTAVPVFPRRLFTQGNMFVHASAGINSPGDLRGKRVAVWSFQTTLSVLAKGDLKFEYGVPWETIRWLSIYPEEMPIKIEGVSVEQIPSGKDAAQLFLAGEIDAMIHPHPPSEILSATNKVRRLFKDWRSEAVRYFRKYGHYPIMHLLAMPNDLADREPWLPRALIEWWEEAKTMAAGFYHDPSYALMPFAHCEIDTQNKLLGRDPWTSGLAANRKDLEKFLAYSFDQRLTEEPLAVEDLFHRSVLDT